MKRFVTASPTLRNRSRLRLSCSGLAGFALAGFLACGGGGSSSTSFEFNLKDFVAPNSSVAHFEDDVEGALPPSSHKTGVSVRYKTDRLMRRRFCLQAKEGTNHTQVLRSETGSELLRMSTADAENCRLIDLTPGAYVLTLYHDGVDKPASVQIVGKDWLGVE